MIKIDTEIVKRTINIPLQAFGLERLERDIDLSELNLVLDKINQNIELVQSDYVLLTEAFAISCEIADELEYPTLTGFSWNQAMEQLGICKMHCITR